MGVHVLGCATVCNLGRLVFNYMQLSVFAHIKLHVIQIIHVLFFPQFFLLLIPPPLGISEVSPEVVTGAVERVDVHGDKQSQQQYHEDDLCSSHHLRLGRLCRGPTVVLF